MKKYFVISMLGLCLVYGAMSYSSADAAGDINTITFSDEMWGKPFVEVRATKPTYLKKLDFRLQPPPSNDSKETRADLDKLLADQANRRDAATVEAIKFESTSLPFYVFEKAGLLDPSVHKKAEELLQTMDGDIGYYVMREKYIYKRARPTQLEPKLTTVIDVPAHPAYPSAHSTQFHAAAYLLSDLDPANKDRYIKLADEVAERREVAGVHYPSDTKAGVELAKAYYAAFIKVPKIKAMMAEAKQEHQNTTQTSSK